ncbi:MAG: phosphoribosyl-ATP diphosphatase [Zoogloeaceae bacterium]|jgi:phosphoribosyl-ATP pyrophosphohydrolase|nr:phosphoribosyl-ATP diphosphatase [Zoogloeaceae bacterium]
MNPDILGRLAQTFAARRSADPATSYTASLFARGPDAILKKIGEEATELVLAGKDGKPDAIVHEASDLVFHVLMLLSVHDLSVDDIKRELERREGTSGIEEKASRSR